MQSLPFTYDPPREPLEILFLDDALIVVNKPSGLLTVPGARPAHKDSLQNRLLAEFPDALLVHRLDMDTSGVVVFARSRKVQAALGRQFEGRSTGKIYEAVVWGRVAEAAGTVDLPLIADWPNRPRQKVCHDTGKRSVTDWRVLAVADTSTRVELVPKTGRSHQLRVHMLELGHPILGDSLYAHPEAFAAAERLLLHARTLTLQHPGTLEQVSFTSPTPF